MIQRIHFLRSSYFKEYRYFNNNLENILYKNTYNISNYFKNFRENIDSKDNIYISYISKYVNIYREIKKAKLKKSELINVKLFLPSEFNNDLRTFIFLYGVITKETISNEEAKFIIGQITIDREKPWPSQLIPVDPNRPWPN